MTCKDCKHWYMCMDRSREYICASFEPKKKSSPKGANENNTTKIITQKRRFVNDKNNS